MSLPTIVPPQDFLKRRLGLQVRWVVWIGRVRQLTTNHGASARLTIIPGLGRSGLTGAALLVSLTKEHAPPERGACHTSSFHGRDIAVGSPTTTRRSGKSWHPAPFSRHPSLRSQKFTSQPPTPDIGVWPTRNGHEVCTRYCHTCAYSRSLRGRQHSCVANAQGRTRACCIYGLDP